MTKITWITSDSFIDCDINVIKYLQNKYSITWILLFPPSKARFKKDDFINDKELSDIKLEFVTLKFRLSRPNTYFFWFSLSQKVKKTQPDIIYYNGDILLFNLPFIWTLNKKKLIVTIHEGKITTNNRKVLRLINISRRLSIPYIKYINCFSNSQAACFAESFKNNKIFVIPLALKDFGQSTKTQLKGDIVFFNFGRILPKKNIDLLIDAACNIFDQGYRGFKIAIFGQCDNWEFYSKRIKYPELFICDIRQLDNSEIKNLFTQYHYLVLPYKVVSQSGPLKIAFNYNIPVIVSDQPGFTDEVIEGINGFIFKTGDVKSLELALKKAIDNHVNYDNFRNKMKSYIKNNYSINLIGEKYHEMFNEVKHK